MKKIFVFVLASIAALTMGGCASYVSPYGYGGNPMFGTGTAQSSAQAYTTGEAQQAQLVYLGTIVAMHQTTIAAQGNIGGGIAGGLAGGLIGSTLGRGVGGELAALAGAGAGYIGGRAAENAMTKQNGVLITVRLDNGKVLAVTQTNDQPLKVGQHIQLLQSANGISRVIPL